MKKLTKIFSTLVVGALLLPSHLGVQPANEGNLVSLTSDKMELNFTSTEPQIIELTPSDIPETYGKQEYVYLNDEYRRVYGKGFSAYVDGVETGKIKVVVYPTNPFFNGNYILNVNFYNGPDVSIKVNVNIDVKALGLYTTTFEFDCDSPAYGKSLNCNVYPEISGDGKEMVAGTFKTTLSYQVVGTSKWRTDKPFTWDIKKGVVHTSDPMVKPTKVRAEIVFDGQTYNFETIVKLKSTISISAPGAAIVGESFNVQVKTSKQHSGTCSLFGTKFNVRNGVGSTRVYGIKPGNLTLWVICAENSTWASMSTTKYMYIRD